MLGRRKEGKSLVPNDLRPQVGNRTIRQDTANVGRVVGKMLDRLLKYPGFQNEFAVGWRRTSSQIGCRRTCSASTRCVVIAAGVAALGATRCEVEGQQLGLMKQPPSRARKPASLLGQLDTEPRRRVNSSQPT